MMSFPPSSEYQSRAYETESSRGTGSISPSGVFSGSATIRLREVPASATEKEQDGFSSPSTITQGKMRVSWELPQKFNRRLGPNLSAEQEVPVLYEPIQRSRPPDFIPRKPYVSRRSGREAFFEDSFNQLSRLFEEYDCWQHGSDFFFDVRPVWIDIYDKFGRMKVRAEEYKAGMDEVEEEDNKENEVKDEDIDKKEEEKESWNDYFDKFNRMKMREGKFKAAMVEAEAEAEKDEDEDEEEESWNDLSDKLDSLKEKAEELKTVIEKIKEEEKDEGEEEEEEEKELWNDLMDRVDRLKEKAEGYKAMIDTAREEE